MATDQDRWHCPPPGRLLSNWTTTSRSGDAVIAFHGAEPSVLHSTEALVLEPEVTIVVAREGGPEPITFATRAGGVPEHVWERPEVERR
ncbi:hypothetical protein [Nonomuraea sp. NPDC003709]|uniref:hypothetical protein n=1 Tax=Nonomuraea sp. NPDC003709 TaxID=3154450 RepID=UPI0033A9FB74